MTLSYSQITAITHNHILKKLTDNVYDTNAILKRLSMPDKIMLKDGGVKIQVPVINSTSTTGGWYEDLDTLDTSRTDNITAAELEWKQAYESIRVSRKELLQNKGDAAVLSLIASKAMIAEKGIKDRLATGLFSDGTAATGSLTTKQMTGLRAILSTSVTYGGIAVADMAEWIAVVNSNSGNDRGLTFSLMQDTWGECTVGTDNDTPSMLTMNQKVYDQAWSLYQPHQRLMSEEMAALGFKNVLTFNGSPMLVDSHQEANTMYFLNENYLKLCVHKDENLRKETLERLETSNSLLSRLFWMGNLVCMGRKYQGVLADLDVAS